MTWLKALLAIALAAFAAGLIIRAVARLPSLADRSESSAFAGTDDTRLGKAVAPMAAAHPGLSGVRPLPDPLGAFAARVLLARAAEQSIDAQYYIWHGDLTGTLLFNELIAAADRGVRVRLLQDDNTTHGLDATLAALDAHPNIEVRLFNPFVIRSPRLIGYLTDFPRLNRRMHNKSFTVDNQATIVGGRNIGDEYFGAADGALFADLDLFAVGPVVRRLSSDFDLYWASASSYPADRILPRLQSRQRDAVAARSKEIQQSLSARRYVDAIRDLGGIDRLLGGDSPLVWAPVRMVSDDPAKGLGRAAPGQLLISHIDELLDAPKDRLGLVSGYFVPTDAGVEMFAAMARRGVRVNIVTNAVEATDVPIVHSGYAKDRKPLLKAGVRLWEIRGPSHGRVEREITGAGSTGSVASGSGTALHAKTFTVDGERVFVGSFNFDPRSARLNTELGFVIESPPLARRMDEALAEIIPRRSYEVGLTPQGDLVWIERRGEQEIRHETEPGTTAFQRASISFLSMLPIEWLL